ncbi:MAG: DNA polymerase I [Paludibacteraceae bacterium]
MKTLLLIDAYAMIYRAYYAFLRVPRINSRGENTSAIYGFLLTLDDLIKRISPTHIGVVFDPHGNTFRHDAYELYKAQREAQPEEIRLAVPYIKEILAARRIPVLEAEGYEADDVIGTLAKKGQAAGFEVYMATPDKDYGQLVDEHIYMYRPRHSGGFEKMGVPEVCAKYGIAQPSQVIDLLGLMGDSSDNIPGCKGVGEKTAIALLQQFGNIENLLANTDQLRGALQSKVQTHADEIRFSRFLATICTDVPIAFDENSLLVQSPDEASLQQIYERLEFRSLLQKAKTNTPSQEPRTKESKKRSAPVEQTLDLFSTIETPQEDIETTNTTGEQTIQAVSPSEEGAIASYLLNPEVAYNPNIPLEELLRQLQSDPDLWKLYQEVELPLVSVLRDMERAGVRVDCRKLKEAEEQLTQEANQIEQSIYKMADYVFNINSPKQVGELLFEHLKLDSKAKKSSRGQYSTSEEVLQGLRDKHPVVGAILDYRELKKLISTYVAALPTYINPATGKIHTTYHQTTTATGRLSSSNPNLQNLPIRSERGRLIREAVIADEGCVFLSADYSQIELRLLAHLSQDDHLLHAFRTGQDIHVWTASKIYNVALSEVTSEQRRRAKTANFGIIYGISAFGLSQQLGCSRTEAKQLIDDYFVAFPGVKTYIASQKAYAREHGYATTLFGRKRYLPGMASENATVRAFAERNAVNAPIQGTAADIIKRAMVRIHQRIQQEHLHTQMIMQVHDELNFNVPVAEAAQVRELVVYEMEHAAELTIPLVAACGVGQNWLEAH